MAETDINQIDPASAAGLLAALPLPYSVRSAKPFDLNQHVRDISCSFKSSEQPTSIGFKTQLKHWAACVESARSREDTGWTLGVAGPGSITYPEACAAQLASVYLRHARVVAWVNITGGLGGQRDLAEAVQPYGINDLDALVLTGLRWEGDKVRFDKAFDLLRQTRPDTDRIVVGVGEDPLALTRYMDISINRALCVVESRLVQM